jgi:hypothetical protein
MLPSMSLWQCRRTVGEVSGFGGLDWAPAITPSVLVTGGNPARPVPPVTSTRGVMGRSEESSSPRLIGAPGMFPQPSLSTGLYGAQRKISIPSDDLAPAS